MRHDYGYLFARLELRESLFPSKDSTGKTQRGKLSPKTVVLVRKTLGRVAPLQAPAAAVGVSRETVRKAEALSKC
jgi:hypothetical protein